MKIGFIGTGIMGSSMIKNLMKEHELFIYTRTKSKAQPLIDLGATWCESPKDLAHQTKVILTIVGYPQDVEDIYLDYQKGLLHHAQTGTILVDMTTSTPTLAKKIYEVGKEKGVFCLDAPVSGGDTGAKEGTLTIMVGGDKEVYETMEPVFRLMGNNVVYQGKAGNGQHTKMCNQIAIANNMIGVCEAITYAKSVGLDPNKVLESIQAGSAGSATLNKYAPMIINDDMSVTFYTKHFIKDLKIALDEATRLGLALPGLDVAVRLYESLQKEYGESGIQSLIHAY